MNSVIDLPNEILLAIFGLLTPVDQFNCQLVCQAWLMSSRQIYYEKVKTNNTNTLALLRCLDSQRFHSSAYIKTLSIHFYPYFNCQRLLNKEEFTRLIQHCTNLERLLISPNSVYWDYLHPGLNLSRLTRLAYPELPSRTPSKTTSYYRSLHDFKTHLTSLDIHSACDHWIRNTFGHLLNYLAEFNHLKELTISGGSQISIIHLNDVLKVCKQLTSLQFGLSHSFWAPDSKPTMTRYTALRYLDIYLPEFCIPSLEYIKTRFSELRHLKLLVFHGQTHPWTEEKTRYLQREFIPYLQNLSSYSIKFDMEAGCEVMESTLLKHWPEGELVAFVDVSESTYERTQMTLIKDQEHKEIQYMTTWNPAYHLHPYLRYLYAFGPLLSKLTIKNYTQTTSTPHLDTLLALCPSLHTFTLEAPAKDTCAIIPSTYQHRHLTILELKRVHLGIKALELLCAKGPGIKHVSITDSQLTYTHPCFDEDDDVIRECFSFLDKDDCQLVLNNVTLLMKNIMGMCGARKKYNSTKIIF
ncbi:hypothetical protein G6F46_006580 [Rhizopus delemar]|uniref:F-box domain-containing protein n=2 Tax=Rhizopus TaxID=4842 RepID=A0A9P6Z2Y6_9FUNG|nr:hypothetical protein G6F55_005120 [Rhizopus delemar]KAG1543455.1 hypothetical protein G6F51_006661 [Rhizopus arrhizus]KAG1497248.1 hypothetical protein G6F54_005893 [Rhizopus delemar]KAG1502080.1 hypothetical protein G6F53_010937 [Rhizopus delemar]KAG1519288.1 hypothetical protein G6F52_008764 [Rhizopus delemar]